MNNDVYKVDDIYFMDNNTAAKALDNIHRIFAHNGFLLLSDFFICVGAEPLPIHSFFGWNDRKDLPMVEFNDFSFGAKLRIITHPKRLIEITTKEEVKTEMIRTDGMSHEEFERLLNELDGNSVKTLADKNARYAPGNDALHNFNEGADIDGSTPAQACWGYMTKHLVALRDMVKRNDFHDRDDFMEKCQDVINYVRILWCIGNAERKNYVSNGVEKETE